MTEIREKRSGWFYIWLKSWSREQWVYFRFSFNIAAQDNKTWIQIPLMALHWKMSRMRHEFRSRPIYIFISGQKAEFHQVKLYFLVVASI
jgi:hypothetical protein